jgi:hypothetical protein
MQFPCKRSLMTTCVSLQALTDDNRISSKGLSDPIRGFVYRFRKYSIT